MNKDNNQRVKKDRWAKYSMMGNIVVLMGPMLMCSCATMPPKEVELSATRESVGRIGNPEIRQEYSTFVETIEHGFKTGDRKFAKNSIEAFETVVFYLNRTITPELSAEILDGLSEDTKDTALRRKGGKKNMRCGTWGRRCVSARNWECWEVGSNGCVAKGPAREIAFSWPAVLAP